MFQFSLNLTHSQACPWIKLVSFGIVFKYEGN